jgi:hypothetical protein
MQLIADVDNSPEQRRRRLKSVAPFWRGGTLKVGEQFVDHVTGKRRWPFSSH